MGNLTMTNHPIHLHGHHFAVTCTDGGWIPESARWPEVSTDIPVGAMRAIEFVADVPGDWAIHCHKSHHTMNAMGHNVKTFIGAEQKRDLTRAIKKLVPDYMTMGSRGMAEMGAMEMPMPDNTLPMMTGFGQFGPLEMGGMFSVLKVREGIGAGDYTDPGWYKHPQGTVAYEYSGPPDRRSAAPKRRARQTSANRSRCRQAAAEFRLTQSSMRTLSMTRKTFVLTTTLLLTAAGLWVTVAPFVAIAHEAHGHFSAGEPGDPKKPARIVKVKMLEEGKKMLFEPAVIEVKRGEQIRFVLMNDGTEDHEFILATQKENRKHAEQMKKFPRWSTTIRTQNDYRRSTAQRFFGSSPSGASSNTPA